jgi:hypothetical protein
MPTEGGPDQLQYMHASNEQNRGSCFMKKTSMGALIASAALFGLAAVSAASSTASAAPFGQGPAVGEADDSSLALSVDLRPYRHCHWSEGRRWCHGPHYGDGYYDEYYDYEYYGFPFFWALPGDRRQFRDYRDRRDYGRRDGRRGRR